MNNQIELTFVKSIFNRLQIKEVICDLSVFFMFVFVRVMYLGIWPVCSYVREMTLIVSVEIRQVLVVEL